MLAKEQTLEDRSIKMANVFFPIIAILVLDMVLLSPTTNAGNSFVDGNYKVESKSVPKNDVSRPPTKLYITYPSVEQSAKFGVVLLLHGFMLENTFYSQLMQHVSSHGFIVIAPKFRQSLIELDDTKDIGKAADITAWLAHGLPKVLPPTAAADLTARFALAGHSRGGKTAFGLALNLTKFTSSLRLSALIGIDPVDGLGNGQQTKPYVVNMGAPFSALDGLPVMVVGTTLNDWRVCTPPGLSHAEFYEECERPACHFSVKDYGHLDMLDDNTGGIKGFLTYQSCKRGSTRAPMRRFVGGVMVAFLKAFFDKDGGDLAAIREGKLEPPMKVAFDKDFRMNITYSILDWMSLSVM